MQALGINGDFDGMKPVGYDKYGPLYSAKSVREMMLVESMNDEHMQRRVKQMKKTVDEAIQDMDDVSEKFNSVFDKFVAAEQKLSDQTKKSCGHLRTAANDLVNGLERIQKGANFSALERQVELLERAASALSVLADLEKQGKLEKLLGAMK